MKRQVTVPEIIGIVTVVTSLIAGTVAVYSDVEGGTNIAMLIGFAGMTITQLLSHAKSVHAIEKLEHNTNAIKDALVDTTRDAAYARGVKDAEEDNK